jgi:hypothetical protein
MAFVFTVEDGSGVPEANAYAEVAYVDDYHAGRGNTAWADATLANKQIAIVRATDYLEQVYGDRFRGRKGTQEQGLHWPARYAYDNEGRLIEEVPEVVRRAVAELALRALSGPLFTASEGGAIIAESRSKGGLTRSVTYAAPVGAGQISVPVADKWLRTVIERPQAVRF